MLRHDSALSTVRKQAHLANVPSYLKPETQGATAQVAGIQVDLPKASASVSLSEPKTKAVSVNNDGQVFLDAYPVTLQELEDRLRTEKATNPDFPVVLRGDAAVQYQKVVEVLDILRRLELAQVGLVTGKPKN